MDWNLLNGPMCVHLADAGTMNLRREKPNAELQ